MIEIVDFGLTEGQESVIAYRRNADAPVEVWPSGRDKPSLIEAERYREFYSSIAYGRHNGAVSHFAKDIGVDEGEVSEAWSSFTRGWPTVRA